MKTQEFDYHLPPELIAQHPPEKRTDARLLVVRRSSGTCEHCRITDLPGLLSSGDLLVVNDTRVVPARIYGVRSDTGGKVEVLLIRRIDRVGGGQAGEDDEAAPDVSLWEAFYRASGRPRAGQLIKFGRERVRGEVVRVLAGGRVQMELPGGETLMEWLEREGVPPLPPYIHRDKTDESTVRTDRGRYQTVYAREPGAIAAPTAGLHFTEELLGDISRRGISRAAVTLHVGPGTFVPVKTQDVEEHVMEEEVFEVSEQAAEVMRSAREGGGRIAAVGSTVVRTLETMFAEKGEIAPIKGRSGLFIYPPYRFRVVDAMLTNFHLPKSTLIMMVCAFAGRDLVMHAYREAVEQKYRFYSYGDCMLIL